MTTMPRNAQPSAPINPRNTSQAMMMTISHPTTEAARLRDPEPSGTPSGYG